MDCDTDPVEHELSAEPVHPQLGANQVLGRCASNESLADLNGENHDFQALLFLLQIVNSARQNLWRFTMNSK
jgi:hypothetical protein